MPLRIGLTGGIASGKSTVADLFAEHGVVIIDTDVIAREVVAPGQPALDEIAAEFGASLIDADGTLDRAALRNIIQTGGDSIRGMVDVRAVGSHSPRKAGRRFSRNAVRPSSASALAQAMRRSSSNRGASAATPGLPGSTQPTSTAR